MIDILGWLAVGCLSVSLVLLILLAGLLARDLWRGR